MESFYPNQRWTSEAEPELGIGIVTETSKGRVQISFPTSGEMRLYAVESAPLRRVRFKPGDRIVDVDGRSMEVESLREQGELILYVGKAGVISESELGDVRVSHGADDRLLVGDVDTPAMFAMRRRTLEFDHRRRISPIHGFGGGRIDLVPHQLYIAQEVAARYAPRVLLSDEVGLGKTIEACLILHRLLLSGRISRVLILVPESLVHQWFVELLRRFNMWFHIFDEERCLALDDNAPDGNPFLDDQLVLCSTSFLAGSQKRLRQAMAAGWDMLVVDEAHHLEWSVEAASPAYMAVELLSRAAEGLLLLTATPEQLGLESHFARLRLLDPERYSDFQAFQAESHNYRPSADLVEKLSNGQSLDAADKALLEALLGEDCLEEGEGEKESLIQDLLDQHGPGRVVFRNTRAAMSGFPQRKAHPIPLPARQGKEDIVAVSSEFALDLAISRGKVVRKPFHYEDDPRLAWLIQFLEELRPAKVLLICNSKKKVQALERALRGLGNLKVGVFHESLSLVQRDRNAAWFAETDGARLLLCSEIGSEGRNFQFAHHLVLFDQPLQPELLEQRIGRLDRIGQTKDIQIYVPYIVGSPQHALFRWYHEGLNAFERNLEGGNQISRIFRQPLLDLIEGPPTADAKVKLTSLIAETKTYHSELQGILAAGRDRLLEMNSFRPSIAAELVEQIQLADQDRSLEIFMTELFDHFTLEVEDLAPRTYHLRAPHSSASAFPSLPDEGGTVTFDRKCALSREEIGFLTWDHPMVTDVMDLVLGSAIGNASFGILPGMGPGMLLEAVFVLEAVGKERQRADRFLPRTPIRMVVNHLGLDVTADFPVEEMERRLRPGEVDGLIGNEAVVETIVPNMLAAAMELAEDRGEIEVSRGLTKMRLQLRREIRRLEQLQERNGHVRPEEIEIANGEREMLDGLIRGARIRLDAVQLIQLGELE